MSVLIADKPIFEVRNKVITLSSRILSDEENEAISNGFDSWPQKPISLGSVLEHMSFKI